MNETLEDIGRTLFKYWFVDFEFPDENCMPCRSSGGEMIYHKDLEKEIPKGWELRTINDVVTVNYVEKRRNIW